MSLDYYKILEVDKTANDDDLKKAYKRLAMKWHPDKNRSDTIVAEANFKLVSEAYDVLNDPNKRAVYDLFGEDGLKAQMPPPPAAAATGSQGGATSSQGNNCPSNAQKADEVFAEILRSSGQNRGMGGVTSGGGPSRSRFPGSIFDDDLFAGLRGGASGSGSSTGGSGGDGAVNQSAQRKASPVEKNLPCSLEELYNGATKKMKISREVVDTTGKSSTVEEILNIDIKPGWRKGTKITFPNKGNELPNIRPADLVFIIDERRHSKFTRDKNDLVVTYQISLVEALTGCTIQVKTLDGRVLTVPITQVVHPSYEEIVPNEGMPVAKEPNKKGNLRIKFNIKFPERLTQIQKNMVRDLFK